MTATDSADDLPLDFNDLIHHLRGRELERLPPDARVVLSGGCPNRAYFDWFADHAPTVPTRHLGIELFRDPPDDLPPEAEYVRGNLGDLAPVPDGTIDLVFAGQIVEHLWADDLTGFLVHAHRVLRPGGHLVLDSPNRLVTAQTRWHMPEHSLELTPSEARELLMLAGFDVEEVRGLWLCADPTTGQSLPLHPDPVARAWSIERRCVEAASAPDSAFVWWATAQRGDRAPDRERLAARIGELFSTKRPEHLAGLMNTVVGIGVVDDGRRLFLADAAAPGPVLIGPYVAFEPGAHEAVFTFEGYQSDKLVGVDPDAVVAVLDVLVDEPQREAARVEVRARELPASASAPGSGSRSPSRGPRSPVRHACTPPALHRSPSPTPCRSCRHRPRTWDWTCRHPSPSRPRPPSARRSGCVRWPGSCCAAERANQAAERRIARPNDVDTESTIASFRCAGSVAG